MTPIEELCKTIDQMVRYDNARTEGTVIGLRMLKKYAPGLWTEWKRRFEEGLLDESLL